MVNPTLTSRALLTRVACCSVASLFVRCFRMQAANADKKECPKCQTRLPVAAASAVKPAARGMGDKSPAAPSASSAMESSGGSCPQGGPHTYKFGMCSKCKASEGKVLKAPGAVSNPGGAGGCPKGGKHMYKYEPHTHAHMAAIDAASMLIHGI